MILKEAYRYQNYLQSLIDKSIRFLSSEANVTNVKEEHLFKDVDSEKENEIKIVEKPTDLQFTPNQVIDFLTNLLAEKELLTKYIHEAKINCGIDIDGALAINKQKQNIAYNLTELYGIKARDGMTNGYTYKFNNDGNQVQVRYDIKKIITIDFDRNKVKAIIKKLKNESDHVSNQLDKVEIETQVNYLPTYDVNGTFEDALETYVENNPVKS